MFCFISFVNYVSIRLITNTVSKYFLSQKVQVEDRLKFYENLEKRTKKSLEVMNLAMAAVEEENGSFQLSRKEKKKNKRSKRKADEMEAETEEIVKELVENENPKKKKQKV